jgi:hypothetical protein
MRYLDPRGPIRRVATCLALTLLLGAGSAMGALPPEFQPFLDFVDGTNPVPSVDVPEVGTIEVDSVLRADFTLPAGVTTSTGETVIPEGTPVLELERAVLEAMTVDDFLVLVSGFLDTSLGPEQRNYHVVISRVDTRNFPEVSLELRMYPRDVRAPLLTDAILAGYTIGVTERVTARFFNATATTEIYTRDVPDGSFTSSPKVQLCRTDPVATTIALDTSCTMQWSINQLKDDAVDFMSWFLDSSRTGGDGDAISIYAFDGTEQTRVPDFSSPDLFYLNDGAPGDALSDAADIGVDRPCRGRPIFTSMREELDRLAAYNPRPDQQWMLAAFSDFKDTTPRSEEDALIAAIEASPATVVGLGFGNVHMGKVGRVFDIDDEGTAHRGIFIRASETDPAGSLRKVYESAGRTYCVKYTSAFPNHYNEVVQLELRMQDPAVAGEPGLSRGYASYALPLVVPEDTRDVRIFLPMVDEQFATLRSDTTATGLVRVRYEDPRPDATVNPEPNRGTPFEINLDAAAVQAALDDLRATGGDEELGKGIWLRDSELGSDWSELFRVPTHYEPPDPDDSTSAPSILELPHYELDIEFTGTTIGDVPYESVPVLTVQDRTPPHLFVRLIPETGRPPGTIMVREETVDVDPNPLLTGLGPGDRGRLDSAMVIPPGVGPKLARADFEWSLGDGTEFGGTLTGQNWAVPDPADATALPIADLRDAADAPQALFGPPNYVTGGLEVAAGVRVSVQVLARDNYAGLAGAAGAGSPDATVWTDRQVDDPAGPVDARFDINRPEAQAGSIAPPFFPTRTRADLAADPGLHGVTWWVESFADRDRFAGFDGIEYFQYPTDDAEVMLALSNAGVVTPPFPVRLFHVYAQDGQGNSTAMTLPLIITGTSFQAMRVGAGGGRR